MRLLILAAALAAYALPAAAAPCLNSAGQAAECSVFAPGTPTFSLSGDPASGPLSGGVQRSGLAAGLFVDQFQFTVLQDGVGSSALGTSASGALGAATDVDFLRVFLNGVEAVLTPLDGNAVFEFAAVAGVPVANGVLNTLRVEGLSYGEGSYGGNVSFTPMDSAVPEPGTWAMLLLGFGALGAAMRRRRSGGRALGGLARAA